MAKILVCGISPGRPVPEDYRALAGSASLRRLAALSGLSEQDFLDVFETDNIVHHHVDSPVPRDLAVPGAKRLIKKALAENVDGLVMLGTEAAASVGVTSKTVPMLMWWPRGKLSIAWCPHPSGRNRWWNEHENVARAADFWHGCVDAVARPRAS